MVQVFDLVAPMIRFFRSPASQFASGEAPPDVLQSREISSRLESWYLVDSPIGLRWVPAQNLIYLRDFYQQSPSEQSGFLTTNANIMRFKNGWRPAGKLKIGSPVTISLVRSDWACGWDSAGDICVPSKKVLLAVDGATKAQSADGKWHSVKSRVGHQILTAANHYIPLSKIKAWESNPNYAFLRAPEDSTERVYMHSTQLVPFSRVTLVRKELRRWHQSIMPNHGNVWWQKPEESRTELAPIILSREELAGRSIYDQTPPMNKYGTPKSALVSADGIFFSRDGETWTLLKQFGESNHPVTIGPRNTLIVGDQLSFDEGKTFQSYLRWDQIAQISQSILKHAPKHLRLSAVQTYGRSSLKFDVDTGYKILTFEFNTINSQIRPLATKLKDEKNVSKER